MCLSPALQASSASGQECMVRLAQLLGIKSGVLHGHSQSADCSPRHHSPTCGQISSTAYARCRDLTWILNKACTARWSLKVMLSIELYASWRAGKSAMLLLLCRSSAASWLRHSTRSVQAGVLSFSFSCLFGEALCTIPHFCIGSMPEQGSWLGIECFRQASTAVM